MIGRFFIFLGIDPRVIYKVRFLKKYFATKKKWLKQGGVITKESPILVDFNSAAGSAKGEYFHQDLLVAKMIFDNNPKRHIDVGSRIDGFVAHVASFREIEVLDIRPLKVNKHNNIKFIQADLMNPQNINKSDSLSCLHAIEHFGLGRYNDPIDIFGHIKGLKNLLSLLEINGILYISFPIGEKDEIHFNEQRVFHPKSILNISNVKKQLKLRRFDYIDQNGDLHTNINLDKITNNIKGCGIYTFKKIL